MTTGQPGTGSARPTPTGDARIRPAIPTASGTPTLAARTAATASDTTTAAGTDHPASGDGTRASTGTNDGTKAATATDDPKPGSAKHDGPGLGSADGATTDRTATDSAATDSTAEPDAATGDAGADGAEKDSSVKAGAAAAGAVKAGAEKDGAAEGGPAEGDDAAKGAKGGDADGPVKADGEAKSAGSERWEAFASAPEPVPSRLGRAARAVGRFLIHEWTLATLGALALAVLMTWPTLRYPRYTLPQDHWDPSLQAWQMAWSGHILLTEPARLWQSNTFFPELWSFAFSDTLLGYAPAGMLGNGPEDAVLRYNIMFVLAHALATLGRTRWPGSSARAGSVPR